MEQQNYPEPMKKKKVGFTASHYIIAGIAGLFGGFFLQGPEFPLRAGATFSFEAFLGYTILSTAAILAFMRLNQNRE